MNIRTEDGYQKFMKIVSRIEQLLWAIMIILVILTFAIL